MAARYREISLGFSDEKIREGLHIIYIFNDDVERKKTMAKFLQQGLTDHEKVLYLVSDISPEEMKLELLDLGVDVEREPHAFDLTKGHHTHCPGNCFSKNFMLGMVAEYYDNAIREGFEGARGVGEMTWALSEKRCSLSDLLEYEASLNDILTDHPLTTVCQYDARKFDGSLLMDLLSVHPMMIVRGQLVKNPCYVKPAIFLKEYEERMSRNMAIGHA
jgi:hypothetical protein